MHYTDFFLNTYLAKDKKKALYVETEVMLKLSVDNVQHSMSSWTIINPNDFFCDMLTITCKQCIVSFK